MLSPDGNGHASAPVTMLITGGTGFVGSHLADELLLHGYPVRVLDNLDPQVHGPGREWPDYLDADVECLRGEVRDAEAVRDALRRVDAVFHFAAAVGVGQSMYEIEHYTDVNNRGTAVLLEVLTRTPVARLVVASGMSIHGEGLYCDRDGNEVAPPERPRAQLQEGRVEFEAADGEPLTPLATPETKPTHPASGYALSKLDQEKLCLMIGAVARGMQEAMAAVADGALDPFPLITHSIPLADLGRAFDLMRARPDGFMKALVVP